MTDSRPDKRRDRRAKQRPALSRTQELQLGLPGERLSESHLVEKAVRDLNRIHLTCALDYCLKVGEYVLDTFFDGQVRQFDRRAKKHRSFRSLAESGRLTFSSTYLWTSVAVASQYRQLPPAIANSLPLSHHRMLLSVDDVRIKRQLADQALHDSLSKRKFAEVVQEHKKSAGRAGPGRPPHPPVLKHLTRLDDALQALVETPEPDLQVDARFRDRVQDLVDRVREDLRILEVRLESLEDGFERD